jgi:ABC-type bacteriocin/lantibiotic exporter with double-glycine peptidase domain
MNSTDIAANLRVHYYAQDRSGYDCGPACIRMVVSYLKGTGISEGKYKRILKLAMNGDTKYSCGTPKTKMKRVIHQLGYRYRSIYGIDGLKWALENELPVIALCHMRDEEEQIYEHYVTVTGIRKNFLHINDPYHRMPRRVRISAFMSRKGNLYWKPRVKWGLAISEDF